MINCGTGFLHAADRNEEQRGFSRRAVSSFSWTVILPQRNCRRSPSESEPHVSKPLRGYEQAASSGLCHGGAWEAAIDAVRQLDLKDPLRKSDAGQSGVRQGGAAGKRLAPTNRAPQDAEGKKDTDGHT